MVGGIVGFKLDELLKLVDRLFEVLPLGRLPIPAIIAAVYSAQQAPDLNILGVLFENLVGQTHGLG